MPEPEPELAPEPEPDPQAIYYEAEQEAEEQPTPTVEGIAQMEPEEPGLDPAFAAESLDTESLEQESYFELETVAEEEESETSHSARDIAASWRWINKAWRTAPRDLKAVAVLLPAPLAVALSPPCLR